MTLAHRIRRSESPLTTLLSCAVLALAAGAAGFVEGAKVRECPARLPTGERLLSFDPRANRCTYDIARPRPYDWYSPTELRRIAAARERLERVKEKTK